MNNDLISRKRIRFELGESNMPEKYRKFCLRVIDDENLTPTVTPKLPTEIYVLWTTTEIDEEDPSYEVNLASFDLDLIKKKLVENGFTLQYDDLYTKWINEEKQAKAIIEMISFIK